MTYYRYSALVAVCFTCLSLSPSYGQSDVIQFNESNYFDRFTKTEKLAQALLKETINNSDLSVRISVFDRYLQEAYKADAAKDYLNALTSFQKALSLQPNDSTIKEAIKRLQNYVYDRYMLDGYKADRHRDYQAALQLFLKAKELRPEAFHAQQAVNNVTYYLAQAQQQTTDKQQQKQKNILLLGVILFVAVSIGSFALFSILKSSSDLEGIDKETEDSNSKKEPSETKNLSTSIETSVANNLQITESQQNTRLSPPEIQEFKQIPPQQTTAPIAPTNSISSLEEKSPVQPQLSAQTNNNSLAKVDIVTELIEDLNQPDIIQRRKVIWELAQRADSRAMKPLVELMIEADSQERSLILEALSQIAARSLKPLNKAIAISLEDSNAQVRKNAIRDLTRVYELMSQVTTRLAQSAGDPDEEVKETALWALQQLNQMPRVSQEFLKMQHHKALNSDE
ncbi:MAG: HEAT repeat domain-containing protein [Xenococcaceae cyanobacterium]